MSRFRHPRSHRFLRSHRFFRRFRLSTEALFSPGNLVSLIPHGGEFFPTLFAALDEARESICLEFYLVRDDSTGRRLAERLLAAADRGVQVLLLYDYIGSFDTPNAFFRKLERDGVRCAPFNPPPFRRGIAWFDKRDHRKMVIIDGRHAFVGGINIADEYDGFGEDHGRWRDVALSLNGPAARQLQRLFLESWGDETGTTPLTTPEEAQPWAGRDQVLIVSGGPHHNRSYIRSAFRMAMAGATGIIRIANPYFIPGPRVVRSLLRAARRGIRIQLMLPAHSDVPLVRLVSRGTYAPLLKAGIEIYEREKTMLHAKVMLIDDYWSVIGSANLDQRSFHRNYEVNVIVDSHEFGRQVAAMFATDLALSRRIVLDEHERRGWFIRLLERLCSTISWFL